MHQLFPQLQISHGRLLSVAIDVQSFALQQDTASSYDLVEGRLIFLAFLLKLLNQWISWVEPNTTNISNVIQIILIFISF